MEICRRLCKSPNEKITHSLPGTSPRVEGGGVEVGGAEMETGEGAVTTRA